MEEVLVRETIGEMRKVLGLKEEEELREVVHLHEVEEPAVNHVKKLQQVREPSELVRQSEVVAFSAQQRLMTVSGLMESVQLTRACQDGVAQRSCYRSWERKRNWCV